MPIKTLMSRKASYQAIYLFLFLFTLIVISMSFYMEYVQGVKSCPLCFMQRICAVFFGLMCVIGLIWKARLNLVLIIQMLFACGGLFFALRQVWLQLQPVDMGGMCMPALGRFVDYISWNTIIKSFFWGSNDCSEVIWSWFGLPMSVWSSMYFSIIILGSIVIFYYLRRGLK